MTLFNRNFLRGCLAALFFTLTIHAAEMELLPGSGVRVGLGANTSQRFAVDVSSNLVNWMQITNVAAAAGQVTFANDPSQADPMRFFRISNGDDTFAIAGYVDGGQFFGGMAGATVAESATGTSVKSDVNGFFHFDQRFFRTNLPITLTASLDEAHSFQQRIAPANAGAFCIIETLGPPVLPFDPADSTCDFKVTGGPRAGLEYAIRFYENHFEITGGITGAGAFTRINPYSTVLSMTNSASGSNVFNQVFLWPGGTNTTGGYGWFSGIPSTNGILAGNGTVMIERVIVAPANLSGLAFSIGSGEVEFTDSAYKLDWEGDLAIDGYSASLSANFWNVSLVSNGTPSFLSLYFLSATNGTYLMKTANGLTVTGEMHQIPLTPPADGVPAPSSLASIQITTTLAGVGQNAVYTVNFAGGASGSFTTQNTQGLSVGSGSYTYLTEGTQAHLHMTYTEFPGDYDDMLLTFKASAGSTSPSSFSGTQRVGGAIYPFTGIFTY